MHLDPHPRSFAAVGSIYNNMKIALDKVKKSEDRIANKRLAVPRCWSPTCSNCGFVRPSA